MTTYDIDATNQSLGRMASKIALLLRGKDKASFQPHIMPDVKVVVHNLDKIVFKGTKTQSVKYYRHSGYPGGIREMTLEKKWDKNPAEVLRLAIRGMLPENRLRDKMLRNVSVK